MIHLKTEYQNIALTSIEEVKNRQIFADRIIVKMFLYILHRFEICFHTSGGGIKILTVIFLFGSQAYKFLYQVSSP